MNFELELRHRFNCISTIVKFNAVGFELGIFSVIELLRISSQNP